MRRRRRRGVGYGGGLGPSPEKVIFCPQNVNFWCILTRFLGKKFWDTDFTVPARNEAYKNSAKTTQYPKIQSDQRGQSHNRPLNTPLSVYTNAFAPAVFALQRV